MMPWKVTTPEVGMVCITKNTSQLYPLTLGVDGYLRVGLVVNLVFQTRFPTVGLENSLGCSSWAQLLTVLGLVPKCRRKKTWKTISIGFGGSECQDDPNIPCISTYHVCILYIYICILYILYYILYILYYIYMYIIYVYYKYIYIYYTIYYIILYIYILYIYYIYIYM